MDSRRRYLIANAIKGGEILPSGYKECEYLESTGTQVINTGIAGITNSVTEIKATAMFLPFNNYIRDRQLSGYQGIFFGVYNATGYVYNGTTTGYPVSVFNQKHTFKSVFDYSQAKKSFYMDDTLIGTGNSTYFPATNLWVFALNENFRYYCTMRLFRFTVTINGTLNFDLIPCLDNNDVPCMYDTVSQTTFYNAGKGTFLYQLKS